MGPGGASETSGAAWCTLGPLTQPRPEHRTACHPCPVIFRVTAMLACSAQSPNSERSSKDPPPQDVRLFGLIFPADSGERRMKHQGWF